MSHVQTGATRIREHVEDVKFRFGCVETLLARIRRVKKLALIPKALPFGFKPIEWIWFAARAHVSVRLLSSRAKTPVGLGPKDPDEVTLKLSQRDPSATLSMTANLGPMELLLGRS